KAQLTQELAQVVAQVGVQAVEDGRDDLLLLRGCGWLELGQVPVHTGPAHQAEHHTDGGQGGPLHCEDHGPWIEPPQRAIPAGATSPETSTEVARALVRRLPERRHRRGSW